MLYALEGVGALPEQVSRVHVVVEWAHAAVGGVPAGTTLGQRVEHRRDSQRADGGCCIASSIEMSSTEPRRKSSSPIAEIIRPSSEG